MLCHRNQDQATEVTKDIFIFLTCLKFKLNQVGIYFAYKWREKSRHFPGSAEIIQTGWNQGKQGHPIISFKSDKLRLISCGCTFKLQQSKYYKMLYLEKWHVSSV